MYKSINKMLEELPHNMEGIAKTPAANHLFMKKEKCNILGEENAQLLHHELAHNFLICYDTH